MADETSNGDDLSLDPALDDAVAALAAKLRANASLIAPQSANSDAPERESAPQKPKTPVTAKSPKRSQKASASPIQTVHTAAGRAILDRMLVDMRKVIGQAVDDAEDAGGEQDENSLAVDIDLDLLSSLGVEAGGSRRLTVELLRNLDRFHATGDRRTQVPPWLARADERAARELADWHAWRGLPTPDDATDPGEPQTDAERERELHLDEHFARPSPKSRDEKLVEYLKCRASVVYFVDNYCRVRHKEQGTIPFRLWRWQAWLLYRWHANARNVNLKGRQIGLTELAAGDGLHETLFFDTKTTIYISKTDDDAKMMLGRAKVMLRFLPSFLRPSNSPKAANSSGVADTRIVGDNTQTLALAHMDRRELAHESNIVSLPQTPNAGRGLTAALVILDEWAAMEHAESIWGGIEPTADQGGRIIGISTAAGLGNTFWRIYTRAAEGENNFSPAFLGWRRHPGRDEAWYAAQYRQKDADNQLNYLHQEFPADPIEAFVNTNQPVFDGKILAEHAKRIREEMRARKAAGMVSATCPNGEWETVDGLTIYEEANPEWDYILSADVAEGKADGDWNDASVLCRQTGRECASLRGKWKPDQFAVLLDRLGYRYNGALLAVERNSIGQTTLLHLGNGMAHYEWAGSQTPYPNLYHFADPARPGARQDAIAGWPTNVRTKPRVVMDLERALREKTADAAGVMLPIYQPRLLRFLEEAQAFTRAENGGFGAPDGLHDDSVMSRAIGVHLMLLPDRVAQAISFVSAMRERTVADKAAGKFGSYEAEQVAKKQAENQAEAKEAAAVGV
jgi:hypothetical protein